MNVAETIAKMRSCDFTAEQIVECLEASSLSVLVRKVLEYGASEGELVDILDSYALTGRPGVYKMYEKKKPKQGPRERWGYDGPVIPMLPENEWWPLRAKILHRDAFVCAYCGVEGRESTKWCVDHVVPLSRGGTHDEENLVACCSPCNSSKSDRLLSEWRGRV